MNTGTGRRGREGFAKDAKNTFKSFPDSFRDFCEIFASSASGSPIPISNP